MILAEIICPGAFRATGKAFFPASGQQCSCAQYSTPISNGFSLCTVVNTRSPVPSPGGVYMKDRKPLLWHLHLVAFSAFVSAIVLRYCPLSRGSDPESAELGPLFVYAGSEVRAAGAMSRPDCFFAGLWWVARLLTVFTAISYFAFRWEFFGNPNSLGAVMALASFP